MGENSATRKGVERWAGLIVAQVVYAGRDFVRTPVLAFVTVGFPLVFLFMLGITFDDASTESVTGTDPIQQVVPMTAVFAAVMAAYVMLPYGISRARERGILKRLQGTPLPMSGYLAGRVVSAIVVAVLGTTLMLVNGVTAFGVTVPWGRLPAMLLTFTVGVACFAALGFAVAMMLPTSNAVMTFTLGSFFLVAFASGTFSVDVTLPRPLDVASWILPVRHFDVAFADTFDPSAAGDVLGWTHLGVLAGWGLLGGSLGWRRWSVEPSPRRSVTIPTVGVRRPGFGRATEAAPPGRIRSVAVMSWRQARHSNRQVWRDSGSAFFVVAFPVLFVVVVPYAYGRPLVDGVPLAALVTPAMAVFALVVAAYVNMPEAVAVQRERGVLKRLRGTPLPAASYVAGRIASVVWIATVAVGSVLLAGWLVHDVVVGPSAWPALVTALVTGVLAMAALGLMVVALVPDAKDVPAVSLGTFIPLAFVSDLLAFGIELSAPLSTIGLLFPLRHLVEAVDVARRAGDVAWAHLLVVAMWGLLGAAIATWRFRWEPRRTAT